jgi:hypothetical protein
MQVNLDPEHLRGLIAAWRAATDMEIPMHARLKVHFMTRRGDMLSNFSLMAGAWMLLLHGCSVQGAGKSELEALIGDIRDFKSWADEGLQALQKIGLQEAIADDEKQMPDDPQLAASLRKMLGIPKPPHR